MGATQPCAGRILDEALPGKFGMTPCVEPFLLRRGGAIEAATRLSRLHYAFNNRFLQNVSVDCPNLLLVERFRSSVRDLFCIVCQIPARDGGAVNNLFIRTAGYVVAAERTLLRNLQAWIELAFEFLASVKNLVTRDSYWKECVWHPQCYQRGITSSARVATLDWLREYLDEQDDFDQQSGNQ